MTAQSPPTIDQLDDLMVLIPLIMIVIALCLAFAVRIVGRSGRDTAAAGDPYFFAFGEMPIVPRFPLEPSGGNDESGGHQIKNPIDFSRGGRRLSRFLGGARR